MNLLQKLLTEKIEDTGATVNKYSLIAAPEFGGDYKNESVSIKGRDYTADVGKYSTRTGENYFGYVGSQPYEFDGVKAGMAAGAYMPQDMSKVNTLLGLLLSKKIANGEARLMVSPSPTGPNVFFGYEKSFK